MHIEVIDRRVLSILIRKHDKHVEMKHTLTQFDHIKMYTYFKTPCGGSKI